MTVDAISNMDRNIIGNVIDNCNFLNIYTIFIEYSNIQLSKIYIITLNNYINLFKIA